MNVQRQGLLLMATVMLAATTGFAQHMKTVTISGDDFEGEPYMLEELGALIIQKKGEGLEVMHAGAAAHRPEAYRDVDLKTGDKVLMANGHKLKTTEDLKAAIADLEVGGKIKLGVKRGKEVRMVSYVKADPADLPKRQMQMTMGSGGDHDGEMIMTGDGEEMSVFPLMGSGILFDAADDAITVAFMMPHAEKTLGADADVKQGDRLIKLQGKDIEDSDTLSDRWDAIKAGAEVTMVFARGDDTFDITFHKAEAPAGGMMMITN